MKSIVVYESMYGNTHEVADHIAAGLRSAGEATACPVGDIVPAALDDADILVVGGPTHIHGMTSTATRKTAIETAAQRGATLDDAATNPGLRDWFDQLEARPGQMAAAFDTRVSGWSILTGRASVGIAHHLKHSGFRLLESPQSFLVDKHSHLMPGEADRAWTWGAALGAEMARHVRHRTAI